MSHCDDCRKVTVIRARGRCSRCYGRYYTSGRFEVVCPQSRARHRLAEVDERLRTARCSICGPVKVTRCRDSFRCNTTRNAQKRALRARAMTGKE